MRRHWRHPPTDADALQMRNHLERLKALSRKMSEWEARLHEVADARPTLETMHETRQAMEADLAERCIALSTNCSDLDPTVRECLFDELAPEFRELDDLRSRMPRDHELNAMQMGDHLKVLIAFSKLLFQCQDRLEQVVSWHHY